MKTIILSILALVLVSCGKSAQWTGNCNSAYKFYSSNVTVTIDSSAEYLSSEIIESVNDINSTIGYQLITISSSSENVIRVNELDKTNRNLIKGLKDGTTEVDFKNFVPLNFTITINPLTNANIKSVITHELIHALGLKHSNNPASIMYMYSHSAPTQIDTETANNLSCLYK